jgi:two-component system response regulator DegU
MNRTIKVAIVDDHEVFRKCIRVIIEREPDFALVAEADNGLSALEMVNEHRPSVVLMDLNMPVMDGFSATSIIKSRFPQIRVMVLSMHSDEGIRVRAMEAGASHFLSKDCNPSGIVNLIRSLFPVDQNPPGTVDQEPSRARSLLI